MEFLAILVNIQNVLKRCIFQKEITLFFFKSGNKELLLFKKKIIIHSPT